MLLPHAERAEVGIRKLVEYCLNPEHWEGQHKARLFAAALGVTAADAPDLREVLLDIVLTRDAQVGLLDEYGQRYTVDFLLAWRGQEAIIRSGWDN